LHQLRVVGRPARSNRRRQNDGAGRRPAPEIQRLAERDSRIRVTGTVERKELAGGEPELLADLLCPRTRRPALTTPPSCAARSSWPTTWASAGS